MKLRVLIVDDERGIRDLLSEVISSEGHQVLCADSGIEALDRLSSSSIDIVFLDVRMPRGDGMTALKEIHSLWPNLPVIMITGGGNREIMIKARELGAVACMIKPFSMVDVIDMLDEFGQGIRLAA